MYDSNWYEVIREWSRMGGTEDLTFGALGQTRDAHKRPTRASSGASNKVILEHRNHSKPKSSNKCKILQNYANIICKLTMKMDS